MIGPDKKRDERREYEADVFYEVWRSGGNPDAINYDRVDDARWDGIDAEGAARTELRKQREAREERAAEDFQIDERGY